MKNNLIMKILRFKICKRDSDAVSDQKLTHGFLLSPVATGFLTGTGGHRYRWPPFFSTDFHRYRWPPFFSPVHRISTTARAKKPVVTVLTKPVVTAHRWDTSG